MERFVAIAAAALAISAAPVKAETWVTYYEEPPWESSFTKGGTDFKIDVQSISRHGGWIYANSRTCTWQNFNDCMVVFYIGAQCKEQKLKSGATGWTKTRRNGSEWWLDDQINKGNRKPINADILSPLGIENQRKLLLQNDKINTAKFNFLCG